MRFALVTTQIALTLALLGGSGLLLRSLSNVVNVPLGFDAEHVITLRARLSKFAGAHAPGRRLRHGLFAQGLNARPTIGGALVGCALGWIGTRALQSQLFEVEALDPWSWTGALLVLGLALLIAVFRPAYRAAHVDPIAALRAE